MTNEIQHPAVGAQVDRRVRPRLWVVRVVREAYVLADNEDDAKQAQGEIERWEEFPQVTAVPDEDSPALDRWDEDAEICLVYGSDQDLTLAEARRLYSGA